MVAFGKQLSSSRDDFPSDWDEYYVDYSQLKSIIKDAVKKKKEKEAQDRIYDKNNFGSSKTTGTAAAAATQSSRGHRKKTSSYGDILDLMSSEEERGTNRPGVFGAGGRYETSPSFPSLPTVLHDQVFRRMKSFRRHSHRDWDTMAKYGYVPMLEFRHVLDQQIEKLVLFNLTQEGLLARQLYDLSKQRVRFKEQQVFRCILQFQTPHYQSSQSQSQSASGLSSTVSSCLETLRTLTTGYRNFAEQLLQVIQFTELNIEAVRKILKKHDKNFPRYKLSGRYLHVTSIQHTVQHTQERQEQETDRESNVDVLQTHINQLYHFGGLSALIYTLQNSFDELHTMELMIRTIQQLQVQQQDQHEHLRTKSYGTIFDSYHHQSPVKPHAKTPVLANRKDSSELLSPPLFTTTSGSPSQAITGTIGDQTAHDTSTLITCTRETVMDEIYAARERLRETTQYAQYVAAQALVFDDTEEQFPDSSKTPVSRFTATQKLSSLLNLASCFLYMTNYYVVVPTVGEYAIELGSSEAMAGIIIGMTPNAALLATVLYGWWSNFSYRNALIFAACSSVLGNIFYALALRYNSLTMVLVGRFLNGFGSARSINRRYIADTFSKADRTAASADFVSSGAFGMAMGPAIAFLLGHVNFPVGDSLWASVNAPGWVMLCLWSIFLIMLVFFFQEPDRSRMYKSTKVEAGKVTDHLVSSRNSSTDDMNVEAQMEPLVVESNNTPTSSGKVYWKEGGEKKEQSMFWKNVPVMMTLWMYFILKLVLEMLLSSTSTITKFYFGWDSRRSGLFMAFVALLMFPANIFVSRLSQHYEDRELILWALIMMLVSVIGILDFGWYSLVQYIVFSIGIFISTNSLEGPNMSLLSKTLPKSWAKGTFNSGFLATEAGTLARSVGDVLITSVAGSMGIGLLLNGLFVPMAILVAISLVLVRQHYSQMIEADDDDDTASIASMETD